MKQKFKSFLRRMLGIDNDVKEYNKLKDQIVNLKSDLISTNQNLSTASAELNKINKLVNVATDIHYPNDYSRSGSWAVICIEGKGKSCYFIRFVDLNREHIQDIERFLRNFEKNNRYIDAPHGMINKNNFFF